MYFWDIIRLKRDLLKRPLSERESFKYLFATTMLYSILLVPFLERNVWDIYSGIAAVVVTFFGVVCVYKCNRGAKGSNFLQKYLSIGWVLFIRWAVLILIPVVVIYSIAVWIYSGIPDSTTPLDAVLFNLLYISYFWLLCRHIRDVAKQRIIK